MTMEISDTLMAENDRLAEDGHVAEMKLAGRVGYHIFIASDESDPEYLWRAAVHEAIDESLDMGGDIWINDDDDIESASKKIERGLRNWGIDPFQAEYLAERSEENMRKWASQAKEPVK